MKKLVIAAAVLGAFAGTAQAQSSVTLFGVVDTGITHVDSNGLVTATGTTSAGKTFQSDSGINSDRLGFRGTEDLGGGLKAGFWLEAGFSPESGAGSETATNNQGSETGGGGLTFNRRSTVSLIGQNWGEVRIGRDYVPTFWNAANVDPFGYNGIAEIASLLVYSGQGAMGPNDVRTSNGFSYLTPNTLGGFFLQATISLGGNANNATAPGLGPTGTQDASDAGNYYGVNVGYQNGPLYAGVATGYTYLPQTAASAADLLGGGTGVGSAHTTNFGISYDLGVVKPDLFYQTSTELQGQTPYTNPMTLITSTIGGRYTTDVWSVGAVVPLGQGEFRFNYAHANGSDWFNGNHANMFGLGYIYNLSKRTALYAEYAHMSNSGPLYDFNLNGYGGTSFIGSGGVVDGNPNGTTSAVTLGLRTSF